MHEDLSIKNEQLEILYSNLRNNPVWQDCLITADEQLSQIPNLHKQTHNIHFNQTNDINHNDITQQQTQEYEIPPSVCITNTAMKLSIGNMSPENIDSQFYQFMSPDW